ncbi:MAG TPA: helix-turn-helix domain-containing protein [Candidatus Cybelea sp.]
MKLECSHLLERAAEGTYAPETLSWAQLEPGNFVVRYGFVDAGPLRLSLRKMNLGFKGEAQVARQKSVIGIVADARTKARWFGTKMDAGSAFSTRNVAELSTSGPGSFFTVTVDEAALARLLPGTPDALALLEITRPARLAQDPVHTMRLRASMHRMYSLDSSAKRRSRELPSKSIYGTLIPLLAAMMDRSADRVVESSKCLNRRLAAVRVCEAYMREHVDATLTLLDLSRVSGMRSRSLINAFEAVTGYSPMDYLKRIRLSGVQRVLQRRHRDAIRIIDVATDWGFWHMGHFTADYRMMFGETPSQTLLG